MSKASKLIKQFEAEMQDQEGADMLHMPNDPGEKCEACGQDLPKENEESNFDKLANKIKDKEGVSDKEADAIAADAGRKSLGQAEMTRRSVAGREQ